MKWSRFENWFGPIGIGVDMMAERMHIVDERREYYFVFVTFPYSPTLLFVFIFCAVHVNMWPDMAQARPMHAYVLTGRNILTLGRSLQKKRA